MKFISHIYVNYYPPKSLLPPGIHRLVRVGGNKGVDALGHHVLIFRYYFRLNIKVIGSVAFEWSDPESSNTAKAKL